MDTVAQPTQLEHALVEEDLPTQSDGPTSDEAPPGGGPPPPSGEARKAHHMPHPDVEGLLDIPNRLFPEPTLVNIVTVLRRDPGLVGRLSYDLDRSQTLLDRKPLTDVAATGLNVDIASAYDLHASTALVVEAAKFVARDAPLGGAAGVNESHLSRLERTDDE
jgi:hypothetical protein